MTRAVIVADMIRGFFDKGYPLYCGTRCRRIIPNVRYLLEKEVRRGSSLFFICDNHASGDAEFKMFPPHCIVGTPETEVIPELASFRGKIVPKQRYSSFFGTKLEEYLRDLRPEVVVVCGVWTNICVMYTVSDARNRDMVVEVPIDCVASPDLKAHRFALEHMEKVLGARMVKSGYRA